MPTNGPPFLTRSEYARLYRITPKTVSALIKAGRVPAIRVGRQIRIPASAVPT